MLAGRATVMMAALIAVCLRQARAYSITVPSLYTALVEGELQISYVLTGENDDQFLYKARLETGGTVITNTRLPQGSRTGSLKYPCGVIDNAGDYVVKLVRTNTNEVVATSNLMAVQWPPINVVLPETVDALSSDITIDTSVGVDLCDSVHSDATYTLGLYFYNSHESLANSHQEKGTVVFEKDFSRVKRLIGTSVAITCDKIDRAGFYVADITASRSAGSPMAASDTLHVSWSDAYSLTTDARSIFPCSNQIMVRYTHAQCSSEEDKIRLFKREKEVNSPASPIRETYLDEKRISLEENSVNFTCFKFRDEEAVEYCFKYVSVAESGAVRKQYSLCVPAQPRPDTAVDGGWGSWSPWTECSTSTACGRGERTRNRVCDSPPPSHGGRLCSGKAVGVSNCSVSCRSTTEPPPANYTPAPNCRCGCDLTNSYGKIVGTSSCPGSSLWKIIAPKEHVVELRFEVFTLDLSNGNTWIKVFDGDGVISDMLIQSSGGDRPKSVRTKQHVMVIQLYSPPHKEGIYGDETFVAVYKSIPLNASSSAVPNSRDDSSIWESTVTIVGVVLCVAIILATIGCVCHHRLSRKRKLAKQGTAANQALLVNGEVASPVHSGNSCQGSSNVSFGDPSPVRNARGTNTQSPNIARKGHITPTSITSASSPYSVNACSDDYIHDVNILKASTYAPDSPGKRERRSTSREREKRKGEPDLYRRPRSPAKHESSASHPRKSSSPPKRAKSNSPTKQGPPKAVEEDLTPTSPVSPLKRRFSDKLKKEASKMDPIRESIPMGHLTDKSKYGIESPEIPDTRPPVEGRDSLTRKPREYDVTKGTTGLVVDMPADTAKYTANDVENGNVHGKPNLKALPLRDVQRPDGQSPEHKATDPNANTPGSFASEDLSVLNSDKLYPDQGSMHSPGEFLADDFEYDDYVPNLEGSYFNMDPHAYTLTWSQATPWPKKGAVARAASDVSLDQPTATSNNC